MALPRTSIFILSAILFLACCDHDENRMKVCKPSYALTGRDSIVYSYHSNGKISSISYYLDNNSGWLHTRDDIGYNSAWELTKLARSRFTMTGAFMHVTETSIVVYDKGQPKERQTWFGPQKDEPKNVTTFVHDAQNRLIEKINGPTYGYKSTTYEYNDDGNVIGVSYIPSSEVYTEVHQRNLEFDNRPRFFSKTKELEILNLYFYEHEPGVNNKLASVVSYGSGDDVFRVDSVSYTIGYNSDGMVSSHRNSGSGMTEFMYYKLEYTCK